MTERIGHNGGPPLDDDRLTLAEAQALDNVGKRPSILQRHAGKGAPLVEIVGEGRLGPIGTWVLLRCGHWREIRDYMTMPIRGRKRPTKARCGLCRERYIPDADDLEQANKLAETPSAS